MHINLLLIPALLLAISLFLVGIWVTSTALYEHKRIAVAAIVLLLSVPAMLYVAYYAHIFDTAVWFYRLRALPYSELLASGAGLGAGVLAGEIMRSSGMQRSPNRKPLVVISAICCLALLTLIPYLKPVLSPLTVPLQDRWSEGVCLQSTPSTCGPSSAATLLRQFGMQGSEQELATECFTYGGSISVNYSPEGLDTRATRGGPAILSPATWNGTGSMYTDDRSGVSLYGSGYATYDNSGTRAFGYGGGVSWRPSAHLTFSVGPWWDRDYWATTYFSRFDDSLAGSTFGARYVFAGLQQNDFSADIRLDWTVTTRLSLRVYVQPYFSTIVYNDFRELTRPGSREFQRFGQGSATIANGDGEYIVDPDGNGPAPSFSLYNSDFRYSSLRGTASLQWEYLPGSNLNISWTHLRSVYSDYWTSQTTPEPPSLLKAYPDDSVVLKVSYLLAN